MRGPLEKLRFLEGTWVGTDHFVFPNPYGGEHGLLVEEMYHFTLGPGDSFISYKYSARYETFELFSNWAREHTESGYIGIHPTRECLLMYTFTSDGTIRRGLGTLARDEAPEGDAVPTQMYFEGATLPKPFKWQVSIRKKSNDEFEWFSPRGQGKCVLRPHLSASYVRSLPANTTIEQFDEVMKKVAAIEWPSLFHDMTEGQLPPGAEGLTKTMSQEMLLGTLRRAGVWRYKRSTWPSYPSFVKMLSFPHIEGDYGQRLTRFYVAMEQLGIGKDKLDELAKVYPATSFDTLMAFAAKIDWPNLYHDTAAGNLLPGHEQAIDTARQTIMSVFLPKEKFGSLPDTDAWMKHFRMDYEPDELEKLGRFYAEMDALGIREPFWFTLPTIAEIYPYSAATEEADEVAAKQQLDKLLAQATKIDWVQLYEDATTKSHRACHELGMEAGRNPSAVLKPKRWDSKALPTNDAWLKKMQGDPAAKASDNLSLLDAVLGAFGINKDKLHHLANLYPAGGVGAAFHPAGDKNDDVEQERKAT